MSVFEDRDHVTDDRTRAGLADDRARQRVLLDRLLPLEASDADLSAPVTVVVDDPLSTVVVRHSGCVRHVHFLSQSQLPSDPSTNSSFFSPLPSFAGSAAVAGGVAGAAGAVVSGAASAGSLGSGSAAGG